MSKAVRDLTLVEAITYAFGKARPAGPDEVRFLRWMAANPGGTYQEAVENLGDRGLALLIGHLVYDRYGAFRRWIEQERDQSSVLLIKEMGTGSVRYTLKPEAEFAFRQLGLI